MFGQNEAAAELRLGNSSTKSERHLDNAFEFFSLTLPQTGITTKLRSETTDEDSSEISSAKSRAT